MLETGPKIDFLVYFERFFVYAFLRPTSYVLRFWQMKDLIKIHIRVKFYQYNIRGCQVKNLSFSYQFSIHEMAPF